MIKFKTPTQEKQFGDFNIIDPRVHGMVAASAAWLWQNFKVDLYVTEVLDTIARPYDSPHQIRPDNPRVRAVDASDHNLTEDMLANLGAWIEANFPRSDQELWHSKNIGWSGSLRIHGEGQKQHLHFAVEPIVDFRAALGVPPLKKAARLV